MEYLQALMINAEIIEIGPKEDLLPIYSARILIESIHIPCSAHYYDGNGLREQGFL